MLLPPSGLQLLWVSTSLLNPRTVFLGQTWIAVVAVKHIWVWDRRGSAPVSFCVRNLAHLIPPRNSQPRSTREVCLCASPSPLLQICSTLLRVFCGVRTPDLILDRGELWNGNPSNCILPLQVCFSVFLPFLILQKMNTTSSVFQRIFPCYLLFSCFQVTGNYLAS